ncbi:hypothetical protein NC652_022809 [Populus alba x Populus x berolinensis]|nr:hypothetical protein NC652_022809 [Populus alba x Populus x berolinensis]
MQGLQPQDWWDLHHEIDYPLFGSHVSTAVLIPPTPRQLSDATTVDTGDFVASPKDQIQHAPRGSHQTPDNLSFRTQFQRQQHQHPQDCSASGKGRKQHFLATKGVEKEAPPLIIRNKLLRKEGPAVKAPTFGERKSHCLDDIVILIYRRYVFLIRVPRGVAWWQRA